MVDVVRVKPPEQLRGPGFPQGRSGGIRALQPEEELPLQTRCRCSGPSFLGQSQIAGSASRIRGTIEGQPQKLVRLLVMHRT